MRETQNDAMGVYVSPRVGTIPSMRSSRCRAHDSPTLASNGTLDPCPTMN